MKPIRYSRQILCWNWRSLANATLSTLVVAILPGCSWFGFGSRERQPVQFGVVSVTITPPPAGRKPTYVTASALDSSRRSRTETVQQRLDRSGVSAFVLPMGRCYTVTAFTDLNGNQIEDSGEPAVRAVNVIPASPLTAATVASTVELSLGGHRPAVRPAAPAANPSGNPPPFTSDEARYIPLWLRQQLER